MFPIFVKGSCEMQELYFMLRSFYLQGTEKNETDPDKVFAYIWEPIDGSFGTFGYMTKKREKEICEKESLLISDIQDNILNWTPKGKELLRKYGYKAKFTKVAKKIFPEISFKSSEEFATVVQATFFFQYLELKFPFNIYDGYLGEHYTDGGGSLQGSCMKHESCQEYMEVYDKNGVQLAVLTDTNGDVHARALVWKVQPLNPVTGTAYSHMPDAVWFIDRVYYTKDNQVKFMHNKLYQRLKSIGDLPVYAREYQNFERLEAIQLPEGKPADIGFKYKLSYGHEDLDKCPYLDTMWRYVHTGELALYSSNTCVFMTTTLRDTDGNWGDLTVNTIYCEYEHYQANEDEVMYSEYHRSYITSENAITLIDDTVVHIDAARLLSHGQWILAADALELYDGTVVHVDDPDVACVGGDYFYIDDLEEDHNGDYIHPDEMDQYLKCTYGAAKGAYVHQDEAATFVDRYETVHVCLIDEAGKMEDEITELHDRQMLLQA